VQAAREAEDEMERKESTAQVVLVTTAGRLEEILGSQSEPPPMMSEIRAWRQYQAAIRYLRGRKHVYSRNQNN